MTDRLMWFIPPGTAALVIAGIGLLLVVGIVSWPRARTVLGALLLLLIAAPIIEGVLHTLPRPIQILATGLILLAIVRAGMKLLFGESAGGRLVDKAVVYLVALPFRAALAISQGLLRRIFGRTADQAIGVERGPHRPAAHAARREPPPPPQAEE